MRKLTKEQIEDIKSRISGDITFEELSDKDIDELLEYPSMSIKFFDKGDNEWDRVMNKLPD